MAPRLKVTRLATATALVVGALLVFTLTAYATSLFTLPWSGTSSGGGQSTSGSFTLQGSVGQVAVGQAASKPCKLTPT